MVKIVQQLTRIADALEYISASQAVGVDVATVTDMMQDIADAEGPNDRGVPHT